MGIQRSNMISTTFRVWWSLGSKGVKGTDQNPICGGELVGTEAALRWCC